MSEAITVVGGAGGTRARLDDLARASRMLGMAAVLLEAIGRASRAASWVVSGLDVDPERVAERDRAAEGLAWIDHGAGGATGTAEAIEDIAANLWETVRLLEEAERAAGSGWAWIGRAWDKAVAIGTLSLWASRKVVGSAAGTVARRVEGLAPSWMPVHWAAASEGWAADVVNPDSLPDLTPLLYGDDLQGSLALADGQFRSLIAVPRALGERVGLDLPDDLVEALSLTLAGVSQALDEILGDLRGVRAFPVEATTVDAPEGMADLFSRLEGLSPEGADGSSRIAVDRIEGPDGARSWIVEIPGTQDWIPDGGSNPLDTTSNALLMAVGGSDLTTAVESAMEDVGIRPGEEVLLVGHSQGGIAAMALASTPAFADRYAVSAVLTAAAPVGRAEPVPGVKVLSLEHPSDTVPALDGSPNPDTPDWTTVRRDLGASESEADRQADRDIVRRHELATYTRTAAAVEAQSDPSVRRWIEDTDAFWDTDGRSCTRIVFEVTRSETGLTIPATLPVRVPSAGP